MKEKEFSRYMADHWVHIKQRKIEGKNRRCVVASDVAAAAEAWLKR